MVSRGKRKCWWVVKVSRVTLWNAHYGVSLVSISRGDAFKQQSSPSVKSVTDTEGLFGADLSTSLFLPQTSLPSSLKCRGEAHSFPSLPRSISIWEKCKNNTERLSEALAGTVTVLLRLHTKYEQNKKGSIWQDWHSKSEHHEIMIGFPRSINGCHAY